MVNYWLITSIILGLIAIGQAIVISTRLKGKKQVYTLLKEVRKELREHHKSEASLFKAIDRTIVNLALTNLEMPKKKEAERGWNEYG